MDEPLHQPAARFHRALVARSPLLGVFFKTPAAYQGIEVLATTGLDFIVLDGEHAPFDRTSLDMAILASRSGQLPALVRVPDAQPCNVQAVLDMGASGVLVPHVANAAQARDIVAACHYRPGRRGVSGSHRAAGYGTVDLPAYLASADREVSVICQIEDPHGVDNASAIAAVPGVDALFIGPVDLATALGADGPGAPAVQVAMGKIVAAAAGAGCAVGIFVAGVEGVPAFRACGVSLFVAGSDQSLLRGAAAAQVAQFHAAA